MKLPRRKFLHLAAGAAVPPADFATLISEEIEKWRKLIRFAGIKSE